MNETYVGECKFCGQHITISGGPGMTQSQVNMEATLECDCDEAVAEATIEKTKGYAFANIVELFSRDGETIVSILRGCTDALARRYVKSVSIAYGDHLKAVLKSGANTINVKRIETIEETKED